MPFSSVEWERVTVLFLRNRGCEASSRCVRRGPCHEAGPTWPTCGCEGPLWQTLCNAASLLLRPKFVGHTSLPGRAVGAGCVCSLMRAAAASEGKRCSGESDRGCAPLGACSAGDLASARALQPRHPRAAVAPTWWFGGVSKLANFCPKSAEVGQTWAKLGPDRPILVCRNRCKIWRTSAGISARIWLTHCSPDLLDTRLPRTASERSSGHSCCTFPGNSCGGQLFRSFRAPCFALPYIGLYGHGGTS